MTPTFASELVDMPEWDDAKVEVRSMSAGVQARLGGGVPSQALFQAIVACCYDPESGERLFVDGDIPWLEGQPPGPIARLGEVCWRLSGTEEKAVDVGKGG
jgi:hypothetical protein